MRQILMMALFTALAIFVVARACPDFGQERHSTSKSQNWAEELWERAIAAKGGHERLQQVQTLAVFSHSNRGKFSRASGKAYSVTFCRLPGEWWNWSDLRPSPLGGRAIVYRADWGPNSRFFLMRDQLHYLMETKWLRPVPVSARKEVLDGIRVDVVRTELQDGYDAEFFLDPQTHLPREVRFGKHEEKRLPPWNGLALSDYAPCQGIQMARTERAFDLSPVPLSYEMNPEYDPAVFDRPARFEDGPEAWRPKGGSKKPIVRCD